MIESKNLAFARLVDLETRAARLRNAGRETSAALTTEIENARQVYEAEKARVESARVRW